jgi:hypothetical protein
MSTLTVEDRALRMLAAGDSLTDVSVATGLTKDEVAKLRRDFPGTSTQQQPVPQRIGTGTPIPGVPNPALSRAITGASPAPVVLVDGAQPLTIARLLEEASVHSNGSIRRAGTLIEQKLDQLRQQMQTLAADEAAKQQAAAEKARAKAEIVRLEQELAAAKAALKGKPVRTPSTSTSSTGGGELVCRKGCGATYASPQGRGKHEKTCTTSDAA